MSRLNLTLDVDTALALSRHSRLAKCPQATLARELIREALHGREERERLRALARDYAADRSDAAALLADLEGAQLDLLEDA